MLPAHVMRSATGGRLTKMQECPVLIPASRRVVGGGVVGPWTGFCQDAVERLQIMEGMITTKMAMTSAALGQTNLVLARTMEDLKGVPTSGLEDERME